MANGWRYFAQRLTGNPSTDEIFNLDLPLQDVKIVDTLSGPTRITAKIDPVVSQLLAPDGRPLLGKWTTAIYAEHEDGEVFGAILDDPKLAGSQISLNCIGFAGYPQGQPYTESWSGVEVDPLDVVREAWDHLQRQYNGDLGVEVDAVTFTPIRLGIKKTVREIDPKDDPNVGPSYFESGPARLAWYETDDIGDYIDQLASDTPFDYHERHEWDGETIRHHLDFYYPRKGNRRGDLRFVVGENIAVIPNVDTDEYATEVLALGAGEGRAMLRSTQSRPWSGLRRAVTVVNKSARTKAAVNSFARRELAWRVGLDDIADIVVRDHPHAPLAGTETSPPARVGDEIFVQGYTGWEGVGHWCRILEREITPESGDVMKFTIMRSDKLGDPHPLLTPIPEALPATSFPSAPIPTLDGLPLVGWFSTDHAALTYGDGQIMTGWENLVAGKADATGSAMFRASAGPDGGSCLDFTGSSTQALSVNDLLTMDLTTAGEMLVVIKAATNSGTKSAWINFGNFGQDVYYPNTDGSIEDEFGDSTSKLDYVPTMPIDQWRRYNTYSTPGERSAWIDEVLQATRSSNTVGFLGGAMGNVTGPSSCFVKIASLYLFNRKLTDAERAQAADYAIANPSGGLPQS